MTIRIQLAATILLLATNLMAAPASIEPCKNITHSRQVWTCAESDWENAGREVHEALTLLKDRIDKTYVADPGLGAQLLKNIERAQQYWTESVKADCNLEAFEIEEGTQAYQAAFFSCSTTRYEQRAAYLNNLLNI